MESGLESGNGTDKASVRDKESTQTGDFHCLDILPAEMWRELLKKLDWDFVTLLHCRGVCSVLKILAEETMVNETARIFPNRPHFTDGGDPLYYGVEGDYSVKDQHLFVEYNWGTHITTPGDVEKITESKDIVFGNPFPNGCVLFYPDTNLLGRVYNSLEALVNNFSENITTLFYQSHYTMESAHFLKQLSLIFKLKNLRQLAFYYSHDHYNKFDLVMLNKLFQDGTVNISAPTGLRKLYLREFPPNKHYQPLITVFKNFLPNWKHLEELSFNWNTFLNMRDITEQIMKDPPPPKLKSLELQDPTLQLLQYFLNDSVDENGALLSAAPRLTSFYIRVNKSIVEFGDPLPGYSKEETKVIQLFNTLDANQTDLEMLCLELYIPPEFRPRDGLLPLNFEVKFENLADLHVNYITLLRWGSLLDVLKQKLPNVKWITVECTYECMKILNENSKKIVGAYVLLQDLWEVFPELEMIDMLIYEWELERNGKVPENVKEAAKHL